jgi:hypothetical protein
VDAGDGQGAAPVQRSQGHRHEVAGGSEQHGGVQWLGRLVGRAPGRGRAQLEGEAPSLLAPGEHVHGGALVQRDLGGDVGRSSEAVDPEPPARWQGRPAQRAVADDAGAQQGRRVPVVEGLGQPVGVALVDHGRLGVAAVRVPTGEGGATHRFSSPRLQKRHVPHVRRSQGTPIRSPAANRSAPGPRASTCPRSRGRDDRGPVRRQIALGHVQVGAAHAAAVDPDPDLAGSRLGHRQRRRHQRTAVDGPGRVTTQAASAPSWRSGSRGSRASRRGRGGGPASRPRWRSPR